ncbi:MAG: radical SAM protein [Candidatus Woesearchaeota archaeon]
MVKVILISLYDVDSMAIRLLHSVLKKNGNEVTSLFFKEHMINNISLPSKNEYELAIKIINDTQPELVALSVRSSFFEIAKTLSEKIRYTSNAKILWGGVHPTICPEESLAYADMICIGEGEYAIAELCKHLHNLAQKQERANREFCVVVPGIIYRLSRKRKKIAHVINQVPDLNSLPYPDYSDADKFYIQNDLIFRSYKDVKSSLPYKLVMGCYSIMSNRGCFFRCAYCINNIVRTKVRRRSVDNVIYELLLAKRSHRLNTVFFHDDVFTYDKKWISHFSKSYQKRIGLPFIVMTHPKLIDREIMVMLKSAGLKAAKMGIESGSEKIRKAFFNRNTTNEEILRASEILKQLNVLPIYDYIVDNPFEDENDRREGFSFILKIRPRHFIFYSLIYFPRYKLTETALKAGLISQDDVESSKKKVFYNWHLNMLHADADCMIYWSCLFKMANYPIIPSWFLLVISKMPLLQKNPYLLKRFFNAVESVYGRKHEEEYLRKCWSLK